MKEVRVTAPPTGANLGPGFDILGVAYEGIQGDIIEARTTDKFKGVKLVEILNNPGLPLGPRNVVEAVGQKILTASGEEHGIELILDKRMRVGTGMGSSASSSVAAASAVNYLLDNPFPKNDPKMLEAVVHGEELAAGSRHADNAFPSLLGGFVFIHDLPNYGFAKFYSSPNFYFVVASPTNIRVDTKMAREPLKDIPYNLVALVRLSADLVRKRLKSPDDITLPSDYSDVVLKGGSEQHVRTYLEGLAHLIKGIQRGNSSTFGWGTGKDPIITPVRAQFIPGYKYVEGAAYLAGALGFSISGSGPAVFAVTDNLTTAHEISRDMESALKRNQVQAEIYISQPNNAGARRI